ncbi:hypothetical protein SAMN05216417_103102 [Nitrosospira multiformis]|uniref:Uncharacterized protein n=1 Tax=Nitrosospira multiformis TaxID=1231 RepID=A0A1I7G310_9PROT|nr:hypothetical protein SAMN05216417_103102 [Nitrosospira multiformis]
MKRRCLGTSMCQLQYDNTGDDERNPEVSSNGRRIIVEEDADKKRAGSSDRSNS